MTVENNHKSTNNNYPFNNNDLKSQQQSAPFQKLFDVTQNYLMNAAVSNELKSQFNFNSMLYQSSWKNQVSSNNNHGNNGNNFKYLPPPTEVLSNYLHHPLHHPFMSPNHHHHHHGPSPDMIKYIEKIRDDELAIKMKDKPEAKLCEEELWKKFDNLTTEMVITKSGRRMFPAFKVQLSGLDPKSKYVLALEVAPFDDNRFKFHNGKWTLAGKADPESNRLMYFHCESPSTGEAWMQKAVWFNKVKLTNNPTDKDPQHLVLNSMHKYVMRLYVFRCDDTSKYRFCIYPEVFTFKTTEFIAVTAYQNDKITQLKIDNNPFAKGFRNDGSGRREKKRLKHQQSSNPDSPPIELSTSNITDDIDSDELSLSHDKSIDTLNRSILSNEESRNSTSNNLLSNSLKRKLSDDNYQKRPHPTNCIFPSNLFPSNLPKSTHSLLTGTNFEWPHSDSSIKLTNQNLRSPHTVHHTPSSSCSNSFSTSNSSSSSSSTSSSLITPPLLNPFLFNPQNWLSAAATFHKISKTLPPPPHPSSHHHHHISSSNNAPRPPIIMPPNNHGIQMLSNLHNFISLVTAHSQNNNENDNTHKNNDKCSSLPSTDNIVKDPGNNGQNAKEMFPMDTESTSEQLTSQISSPNQSSYDASPNRCGKSVFNITSLI